MVKDFASDGIGNIPLPPEAKPFTIKYIRLTCRAMKILMFSNEKNQPQRAYGLMLSSALSFSTISL